jgi:hypothetical protein
VRGCQCGAGGDFLRNKSSSTYRLMLHMHASTTSGLGLPAGGQQVAGTRGRQAGGGRQVLSSAARAGEISYCGLQKTSMVRGALHSWQYGAGGRILRNKSSSTYLLMVRICSSHPPLGQHLHVQLPHAPQRTLHNARSFANQPASYCHAAEPSPFTHLTGSAAVRSCLCSC